MFPTRFLLSGLGLSTLLACGNAAWANGQTTHIWISRKALGELPAGDLRDLLTDPELEPMLVHGTMFPDGGYAVDHPYGEWAHWEPFQSLYLEWIKENWDPPYEGEARQHIAFLMGLSSHGLADQTFDAFYLDRSANFYDSELGWAAGRSMDEATDFEWAALTGAQEVPERWVPTDALLPLYAEAGVEVDAETLDDGQNFLEAAVALVGLGSRSEDMLAGYRADFPWATSHLQDAQIPGNPDKEAAMVASYWLEVWERLHERSGEEVLLATWPPEGGYGLSTDHTSPDARITLVFDKGHYPEDLTPAALRVQGPDGADLPFDTWLYYGGDSHVLHLIPLADWPSDVWIEVTILAGLPDRFGGVLAEDRSLRVSTSAPPPEDSGQAVDSAGSSAEPKEGPVSRCSGCATGRSGAGLLGVGVAVLSLSRRKTGFVRHQSG